ncbi:MAG TPA: hypothetical protein VMV18_06850 [bacterium]|nr:hypothetical protein [bacterium]
MRRRRAIASWIFANSPLDADKADPAKAAAATEDLLSSKRFLDNVQKEQPKNADAAKLQAQADKLLEALKPTMLKAEIDRQLTELDGVLGKIEAQLGVATRDAAAEREMDNRFDGVRAGLKAVLEKDPKNERALAEKTREDALWQKLLQQRQAAAKGGK